MIFRCPSRHTNMTSTTQDPNTQLDRASFTASVERYRRELHVHCYRMLGSFEESEDLVQETFLRAWRRRQTFDGRSSLRAWLYGIATNACLDALDKRPRTVSANGEVLWLQPYPDELLEELVGAGDDPEATVVSKETIELAYLVAIQRLVPLQRAVLILRDVLGLSAKETASVLETSVPAVNSALQRARAAMGDHLPERREEVFQSWIDGGSGSEAFGSLRCLVPRANRQPAVANYVRKPGDEGYSPLALDVVRIVDGEVADIVTFDGSVFPWFGLPESLSERWL